MRLFRQNVFPIILLCASAIVVVLLIAYVMTVSSKHARTLPAHSPFPTPPGREVERAVSPTRTYVAVVYSSDGEGTVPRGTTVVLQSLHPDSSSSNPVAAAFTSSETEAFQGIYTVNWKKQRILEIETYGELSVLQRDWHGVGVQVKHRDAAQEIP